MFLRNLNLFFPYFSLLSSIFGMPLSTISYLVVAEFFPNSVNPNLAIFVPHFIIALALIIVWWRVGLPPSTYKPERENRFKNGHKLIAVANFIFIGFTLFGFVVALKYATFGNLPFLFIPFALLALLAWIVGLIMIWSSSK